MRQARAGAHALKLVSKFKDYYDALRSQDREPEPVYVRETRTYEFHGDNACSREVRRACDPLWTEATVPPAYPPRVDDDDEPVQLVRGVIGFCGRLHAFVVLGGEVHYDFAAFGAERPRGRARRGVAWWRARERRAWEDFERNRNRTVADDVFRFFDAPALVMTDQRIVVNPRLRDWDFATQVHPYNAWQDISVFLGNNLVKNVMQARPISDELKAHAHGFDKQSFRKSKTGRKKLDRGEW